jgi:hypothetical protein
MKKFVLLVVSIAMMGILFCPMVMAGPASMPADLQIVQPDPSLPKELSAFFGNWKGVGGMVQYFLIVEKIDEEKASLYLWRSGHGDLPVGGLRYEAPVIKERGKYKLWFKDRFGNIVLTLKGEYLDLNQVRLKRVP